MSDNFVTDSGGDAETGAGKEAIGETTAFCFTNVFAAATAETEFIQ